MSTRLVVLDVVVLDKSGHPVVNLDRSQFSITEDKVPQTLRSFDPPADHPMPSISVHGTADLQKIGNAPVTILVFDELNTKFEQTAFARLQMEKYLKSQPETLAQPTLLVAAGDARFVVLHDYTQSRAELLESIRKHFPQYPWQMMRSQAGGDGALERMSQTLGALSQIAESSRGTAGRKNVIWVGAGYPSLDTTKFDEDDQEKMMAVIRRVTDRMLTARVTLFMVDPSGVVQQEQTDATGADQDTVQNATGSGMGPFAGKLEFSTIAKSTGGEVLYGRNDVDREIGRGVSDGLLYYTLSYAPNRPAGEAQQYRTIRITLKDPSLHAVTRDGYFAGLAPVDAAPTTVPKPAAQLKADMAGAAQSQLAYNGLKVEAKHDKTGFLLLVAAKDLHWTDQTDGSRRAEVTVMSVFFNGKEKEIGKKSFELKEQIGKDDRIDGGVRVGFHLPVEMPTSTARMRFVVRDAATGTIGSADLWQ